MNDIENEKSLLLLYFFNSNWVYTFENTQAATHCTLKYMYTCIHVYIYIFICLYMSIYHANALTVRHLPYR